MALESLGRFREAIDHFSEALKLEPQSAENHDNLGVALAQAGRMEEAAGHFSKALEIDSSHEKARQHLSAAQQALERRR